MQEAWSTPSSRGRSMVLVSRTEFSLRRTGGTQICVYLALWSKRRDGDGKEDQAKQASCDGQVRDACAKEKHGARSWRTLEQP